MIGKGGYLVVTCKVVFFFSMQFCTLANQIKKMRIKHSYEKQTNYDSWCFDYEI